MFEYLQKKPKEIRKTWAMLTAGMNEINKTGTVYKQIQPSL
jgi:hypothetical protein